jgi:chromosome partitioning protein
LIDINQSRFAYWGNAMQVLVVASRKGGSGKTTLAGCLAVEAERAGSGPVAILDADPMAGLGAWWHARQAATPIMALVHDLDASLTTLRQQGCALAIIDTAPSGNESVADAIAKADLVIIPVQPSPHDLRAVGATVEMAEAAEKKLCFILNRVKPRTRLATQAILALSQHGPVSQILIHDRTDYAAAMTDGLTAPEIDPEGKAAGEIAGLWTYVSERLATTTTTTPKAKKRAHA